jgi:YidC/Oxa1 family membrane protein insertase
VFQWFHSLVNLLVGSLDSLYLFTKQIGMPSYALAIVLLTVIVNVILYPLKHYQMKSLKKMQDLQPKVKELDAKYKNDPQKKQQELMDLYKQHNANPLTGCLPMIIQMPIFIALYQALQKMPTSLSFINSGHAQSFMWIDNIAGIVSKVDPYYIFPILVAVTTYFSQKVTMVNSNDPTQQTMLIAMPLLFGFMTISFPAGLAIYWVTFSLVGLIQQLIINKTTKALPVSSPVIDIAPVKEEVKKNDDRKNGKKRS